MKNQSNLKAAMRILEMKGVIDAIEGRTPRRRNEHYNRGYGKQYESEAVISGKSLEILF